MGTVVSWTLATALCALTACGPPAQLEACNIATTSCQEDVYYALVRLRGDGYDPLAEIPPIHTLTRNQYMDQLQEAVPETPDAGTPDDDAGMEEPKEPAIEAWDTALQLLGLVLPAVSSDQAVVDDQVNHVAAFYAPDTQSVTVLEDSRQGDVADTLLLLHELVHALQNRELSNVTDGTTDGILSSVALTEGEATFYQSLGRAEIDDVSPLRLDLHRGYADDLANGRASLYEFRDVSSPFYDVRWFVYPLGASYLTDAWLAAGNAGIRHAYADPRRYTSQFIAGYGLSSGARTAGLRCAITPPTTAYERGGYDRFGALELYAFLTGAGIEEYEAWPLASGWIDDVIAVYFEPDDETVLLTWRIRFADHDAAARAFQLAELQPSVPGELRGEVRDRDLVLIGGNDADLAAEWRGALDCDDE